MSRHIFLPEQVISLQGKWEFYWNQFIDPVEDEGLAQKRTGFFAPGETWRNIVPSQGLGYASYRLKLIFKEEDIGKRIFFKVYHQGGAAQKFFLDHKPILELGKVGPTKESMVATRSGGFFLFNITQTTHVITLHISNFYHYDGAFWYPPEISHEKFALDNMRKKQAEDSFIWGGIFLIFIHHLFIYLRGKKDRSFFFFAIYSFLILIQLFSYANLDFIYLLFPELPHKLAFVFSLNFTIIMPFYLSFLKAVFPNEFSKKIIQIIFSISLLFFFILILFPSEIASYITLPCLLVTLASILYSNYGVALAAFHKRAYSIPMMFTLFIILLGTINDMLYSYNIIPTQMIIKYAYLLSIILQSVILSGIFSDTLRNEEHLTLELKQINESLEEKVKYRTDQLNQEKEKAVNANLWKDKFIALVSHDLRSPLASVYIVLDIFEREDSVKEPEEKELLTSTKHLLKNSLSMVEHLLNLSRFNTDVMKLNYSEANLFDMLEDHKDDFLPILKEKEIDFSNLVPENTKLVVDKQILYEVLRNIIFNAIKFTNPGGKIIARHSKQENFEILTIQDSGVGIPPEKIPQLFSGSNSNPGTKGEKGFGIGLKLCKELIELHSGMILVESEIGKGTEFHIHIPVVLDGNDLKIEI